MVDVVRILKLLELVYFNFLFSAPNCIQTVITPQKCRFQFVNFLVPTLITQIKNENRLILDKNINGEKYERKNII